MLTLTNCRFCPRQCGVDRRKRRGFCQGGVKPRLALATLHRGEEPCLSGANGAGAVFFSGCALRCVYCQNLTISQDNYGFDITVSRLAEIFLELQTYGAATLDLVSPTHFVTAVADALSIAKHNGLHIPVIYNCSGYECEETIDFIAPHVDIFLPDLKYFYSESARDYSRAPDYFTVAAAAIKRMVECKGKIKFNNDGMLERGVLVRHLVLPGHRHESIALIDWLWENFGNQIGLSLMGQYIPWGKAQTLPPLNRRLTTFEYDSVVQTAQKLGFAHGYIQTKEAASADYVPNFDGSGVVYFASGDPRG